MKNSHIIQIFLILLFALGASVYVLFNNLSNLQSKREPNIFGISDNNQSTSNLLLVYKVLEDIQLSEDPVKDDSTNSGVKSVEIYSNLLVYIFEGTEDSSLPTTIKQLNDSEMLKLRSLISTIGNTNPECTVSCINNEFVTIYNNNKNNVIDLNLSSINKDHINLLNFIKEI